MVWYEYSCVKFRLLWNEFRLVRKLFSSSVVSVQIISMSCMYLFIMRG